jgi:uncharacterized protein YajQ (UPF0234 family)
MKKEDIVQIVADDFNQMGITGTTILSRILSEIDLNSSNVINQFESDTLNARIDSLESNILRCVSDDRARLDVLEDQILNQMQSRFNQMMIDHYDMVISRNRYEPEVRQVATCMKQTIQTDIAMKIMEEIRAD